MTTEKIEAYVKWTDTLNVERLIEEAVAKEREACAKIAEYYTQKTIIDENIFWEDLGKIIAQEIRSRGRE